MSLNKANYKQYLPSKKFAITASIVVVLGIIIFAIFFMSSSSENFLTGNKNKNLLKVENQTLADMIQNDSDSDGIADWEEALWGTDKNKKMTFGDMPDATYIENKKKELKIETSVNETKLTETEKFAREFFTSYSAMKSSGQVDQNTINNFSGALGQKIADPNLIDRYSETEIKIDSNGDQTTKQKYYINMKTLFKSYQSAGIGEELDIVSKNLTTSSGTDSSNQYDKLITIANAYQNFAKKIMDLSVPQNLSEYHLQIANSANNTGISILNMSKIESDPIVGLSGLSQYQRYSDELIKSVSDLETALIE